MKYAYLATSIPFFGVIIISLLLSINTGQYTVTGVLLTEEHEPVAGRQVTLVDEQDEPLASVLSDSRGEFSIQYEGQPVSAVQEDNDGRPSKFRLGASYPNPFNPQATVPFYATEPIRATISVYNVIGRQVAQTRQDIGQGVNEIHVNLGEGLAQGTYLLRVTGQDFTETESMMFLSSGRSGSKRAEISVRSGGGLVGKQFAELQDFAQTVGGDGFRVVVEAEEEYEKKEIGIPVNQDYDLGIQIMVPGGEPRTILSFRGHPNISPDAFPSDARRWYDRLLEAAAHPDPGYSAEEIAAWDENDYEGGNLYQYGRGLSTYLHNLLIGLRVTGDLHFLDKIDTITEIMREQLAVEYVDYPGGLRDGEYQGHLLFTPNPNDGYLKWFHMRHGPPNPGESWGTDLHIMNERLTHSTIAAIAFAFRMNTGMPSPGGVDYVERADFWEDYFRNHFEAKWRERHQRSVMEYPLIEPTRFTNSHSHIHMGRLHQYSYQLAELRGAGKDTELAEMQRFIDQHMESVVDDVATPDGDAVVIPAGIEAWGASSSSVARLQSTTYVRYIVNALVDLHLEGYVEGLHNDIDSEYLAGVARALVHFVDDGDPENTGDRFAQSMGGDRERGGLVFDDTQNSRISESRFFTSSFGHVARWDDSGKLAEILEEMYYRREGTHSRPRNTAVPAQMLLNHAPQ